MSAGFIVSIILDKIGWNYFKIIFQVVLFGTFIETGVSLIPDLMRESFQ